MKSIARPFVVPRALQLYLRNHVLMSVSKLVIWQFKGSSLANIFPVRVDRSRPNADRGTELSHMYDISNTRPFTLNNSSHFKLNRIWLIYRKHIKFIRLSERTAHTGNNLSTDKGDSLAFMQLITAHSLYFICFFPSICVSRSTFSSTYECNRLISCDKERSARRVHNNITFSTMWFILYTSEYRNIEHVSCRFAPGDIHEVSLSHDYSYTWADNVLNSYKFKFISIAHRHATNAHAPRTFQCSGKRSSVRLLFWLWTHTNVWPFIMNYDYDYDYV